MGNCCCQGHVQERNHLLAQENERADEPKNYQAAAHHHYMHEQSPPSVPVEVQHAEAPEHDELQGQGEVVGSPKQESEQPKAPTNPYDVQALAAIKESLHLVNECGWRKTDEKAGGEMLRATEPHHEKDGKMMRFIWRGVVRHVDPATLAVLMTDVEFRKAVDAAHDQELLELASVELISDACEIRYCVNKYPWPLTNRDNCFLVTWQHMADGRILIVEQTTTHPSRPETKKLVRVSMTTGYILEHRDGGGKSDHSGGKDKRNFEHPDHTHMTIFAQFDVGGNIPKAILEQYVTDTCSTFSDLSAFIASEEGNKLTHSIREGLAQMASE